MNKSNEESTERLDELGSILAAALSRMNARKSSQKAALLGESSLHISPEQSVDAVAVLDGEVA